MLTFNLFIIFAILGLINIIKTSDGNSYYQIMDNYSFNLKNKNESNFSEENFVRKGDLLFYGNHLKLAPLKNLTSGLFYTKNFIPSPEIELQIKFRIHSKRHIGSAFAVWFFEDNVTIDRTNFGFNSKYNGTGVIIYTPFKEDIDAQTVIYIQSNNGLQNISETGFKQVAMHNSCRHMFLERTTKLTLKLSITEGTLGIYHDTLDQLHQPCMSRVDISGNLKTPYRIAISSLNGVIDDYPFMDSVEIEKFTLFNMEINLKNLYVKNITNSLTLDDNITNNDLILNYPEFKKKFDVNNSKFYFKDLSKKMDNIILILSDIKQNIDVIQNREEKTITDFLKEYKYKVESLKYKINEFHTKLSDLSNSSNFNFTKFLSDFEINYMMTEINSIKLNWDKMKIRNALSDNLNSMLTERVNELVDSLKNSEGNHNLMAGKLVSLYFKNII